MKLGYIHSNKEEQARVLQVLKLTSESVALEELVLDVFEMLLPTRCFQVYPPCKNI